MHGKKFLKIQVIYIYIYICGGLLFRKYYKNCINWAYDPTAQSEDGQIKVIMERV